MIKEGKTKEEIYNKFLRYEAFQFAFSSFSSICLFCLLDKFIIAWVGDQYLLGFWPVLLLCVDYLVHSLFQPMSTLFTSTEKFKEDKIVSLSSAGINIGLSILLAFLIGVEGVIIGTLISNLFTYVMRVRLIYKSYFGKSMIKRLIVGFLQILITAGLCCLCILIVKQIKIENDWINFIICGLVAFALSNTINVVALGYYFAKKKKDVIKRLFPGLYRCLLSFKNYLKYRKIYRLNNKRVVSKHKKPKVVFISQCEHIFDKTKPLVVESIKRGFDVVLYIVKDPESTYDDKTIFEKEFPQYCVKYEDVPFSKLEADYVFHSRPYPVWLPNEIRPNNSISLSKMCYIPYGYSMMELGHVNLSSEFISCINFLFLDNAYSKDYADSHLPKRCKRYVKTFDIGYPYFDFLLSNFDDFIKYGNDCFDKFDKEKKLNVIWAPRWINDDKLGGSNFIRYMYAFNNFILNNDAYNYCFRPHPYALDYYEKIGKISKEQRTQYINNINQSSNAIYDHNSDYIATFNSSDVLVCDVSSVIAEYLLLDKPIIFCHNEKEDILNEIAKDMLTVFYNAYSFDDIKRYLTELSEGHDILKEKRKKYVESFKKQFVGSTKRIIDIIQSDFEKERKNG